jgi:hypothetical protein
MNNNNQEKITGFDLYVQEHTSYARNQVGIQNAAYLAACASWVSLSRDVKDIWNNMAVDLGGNPP